MADKNNLGLADELLADALRIAAAQRTRQAATFKPGSAAKAEIEAEASQLTLALNTLRTTAKNK